MKTVAIIEARITSTRLPGKILLPILGKPMLELLIERLKRSKYLDKIVVATTQNPSDDPVEQLADRIGVGCFRGSEDDVLDRVLRAAHAYEADVIVEITGDCPLIDPEILDKVISTYPRGMETQVFSTAVLEKVASRTQDPVDHEHVSLYIYEHPAIFSLFNVESTLSEEDSSIRLTVDTHEDFQLIKAIYELLYPSNPEFTFDDVVNLLEKRKDLRELNQNIRQKKVR